MSAEENKAISRRYVEEVQSKHDLDAMEDFISPRYCRPYRPSWCTAGT